MDIRELVTALEALRGTGHAITIESSPGEQWIVSIAPIEFHPETENPLLRWQATNEWDGCGDTMDQAIEQALEARP